MKSIILLAILNVTLSVNAQDTIESKLDSFIFVSDPIPTFPGGYDSLKNFIKKNLKYPRGRTDYSGKVYIGFTVNEDGSISDLKILKSLCKECDKNAIEVLKVMPRWIPAMKDQTPIKTKMVIPVIFEM